MRTVFGWDGVFGRLEHWLRLNELLNNLTERLLHFVAVDTLELSERGPAGLATLVRETCCSKESSWARVLQRRMHSWVPSWRCSCSCPRPSMQLAAHHKPGARVERGSKSGSWSSWDCPRRPDSGSSMATAIECGMAAFHDSDTSQLDGCSLFTTVVIAAAAEPGWLAFEGRRAARASVPRCTGKGEPGRLHSGALDSGGQGTTEWRSVGI